MQNRTLTHARFPTRGQVVDFFVKTLEIENVNSADRKRYQRFISEKEITVDEYNETLLIYIQNITEELFPAEKQEWGKKKIENFLNYYLEAIRTIEVFAYNQEDINKVLSEYMFLPFISFLLNDFLKLFPYEIHKHPQHTLWEIFQAKSHLDEPTLKKELFIFLDNATDKRKSDKTLEENLKNWLSGTHSPNKAYREHLSKFLSHKISDLSKHEIKSLFIIAKLLQEVSNPFINPIVKKILFSPDNEETVKKFFGIAPIIFQQTSQTNLPPIIDSSMEKSINYLKSKITTQRPWLPKRIQKHTTKLFDLADIHKPKEIEEQEKFKITISEIEKSKSYDINQNPFITFAIARYYAQQKDFKSSNEYYLKSLENGKNTMGIAYKEVVKEGLIVSAQTTRENSLDLKNAKSPFVKFYKEAYFLKLVDSLPDEINQYFLNDIKKKFSTYFTKLYPDINISKGELKPHEHGIINTHDLKKTKLDFKKPDKWIKNKYPNPMTQLMHSVLSVQYDDVKKLIDAGVNVNEMRFNDNSTALTKVLSFKFSGYKRDAAIKIAKLIISKMSKEALCAKLPKQKMTALGLAIDLGYVEVVKQLIQKGADINQTIFIDDMSPLYYVVKKIGEAKMNPAATLNKMYRHNDSDILKVVNSMPSTVPFLNNAITDQEKIEAFKSLQNHLNSNPRNREMGDIILEFSRESTNLNIERYYQIFELLLNAAPDLDIRFKGNLNTTLMYATELNEVDLVKKLLNAGADKNATIDDTNNPIIKHTARAFAIRNKNYELVSLL